MERFGTMIRSISLCLICCDDERMQKVFQLVEALSTSRSGDAGEMAYLAKPIGPSPGFEPGTGRPHDSASAISTTAPPDPSIESGYMSGGESERPWSIWEAKQPNWHSKLIRYSWWESRDNGLVRILLVPVACEFWDRNWVVCWDLWSTDYLLSRSNWDTNSYCILDATNCVPITQNINKIIHYSVHYNGLHDRLVYESTNIIWTTIIWTALARAIFFGNDDG